MIIFRLSLFLGVSMWIAFVICLSFLVLSFHRVKFKPYSSSFRYNERAVVDLDIKYPGVYVFYVLESPRKTEGVMRGVEVESDFIKSEDFTVTKMDRFLLSGKNDGLIRLPVGKAELPVGGSSFELNFEKMNIPVKSTITSNSEFVLNLELDVDSHLREYGTRSFLAAFCLIFSILGSLFLVALFFLRERPRAERQKGSVREL